MELKSRSRANDDAADPETSCSERRRGRPVIAVRPRAIDPLLALIVGALVALMAARTVPGAPRLTVPAQAGAPATASVWNGVYTAAQAKRGAAVYQELCAPCHGVDLAGAEMAPPLAGPAFMANWSGLTLNDLYDRIRLTMPPDRAGGLPRQDTVDTLAYVLRANGFPAGKAALEARAEVLMQIRIEATKPGGSGR